MSIENIVKKCNQKWAFLKIICYPVNWKTLLQLYKTYILPLIEYSNISYVLNDTQIDRIESIQRSVTKFICYKIDKNTDMNYRKRLEVLCLKPLQVRHELSCLKIVFKCMHNFSDIPENWKSKFVVNQTRNCLLLEVPKTRIILCDKNFFIWRLRFQKVLSPKNAKRRKTRKTF